MSSGRGLPIAGPGGPAGSSDEPAGLWGRAFRPFFLLLALYGAVVVPWWTLAWQGFVPFPAWLQPMWWHGHEMMFGFVAAAVAGFLLTSAPVWTGGPALVGRPLIALTGLWVAGRLALAAAGVLPGWSVALVDGAFLPAVALALARTLRGSGQLHNHALAGIVVALAVANAAMHAEALGLVAGVAARALRFAVDGVVVLLLVITGRITPAFTRNALRRAGADPGVRAMPVANAAAIAAAAALAVVTLVAGRSPATGALAATAAIAAVLRGALWQSWQTRTDPLLWSLHAGSAWLVLGLGLVAAHDLGAPVPASAGLHALTAGAMGTTILAVITRVGLGHTGRSLVLPRGVVACYGLVHGAAVARVVAPFVPGDGQRALLLSSALAWALAYGLFAIRYGAILTGPRVDGRPG